ncbi:MAG TPA: hypothetical protein VNL16_00965, partial [Chloroflexota bacterium]|nr:hypothetical protein [Chloroflexota bacterium]
MRAIVDGLNEAFDRGPGNSDMESLRCARVPALILVGYTPLTGRDDAFSSAVRSLVALRHVDAPKEWGEGPEREALADAVLQEMERRRLLTPTKRSWMAGSITRNEAASAHLTSDPAARAAAIVRVFTTSEPAYQAAVRDAVATQSTRRRLSGLLRAGLATALIVRGIGGSVNVDRIRRYMQEGFGEAVRDGNWKATFRSPDELLHAALAEFEANPEKLGPDRLELAARGAYALIASLQLTGDRGTANNDQPDRRTPGQVVDAMLRELAGLYQLRQALVDHASGIRIRVVDEDGSIVRTDDGAQERCVEDIYLRETFRPAGSIKAPRSGQTPQEKLDGALAKLGGTLTDLDMALMKVREVASTDGSPLVESNGASGRHCDAWVEIL